ncbi:DUF2771 domain-containing protein [Streptomyces sp. NBC_01511]|uniref:DUF2771 domain-containing protein n=1 Tax=unclassified Streptomyces TaxID=2593676 RepID=UPI0038666E1D
MTVAFISARARRTGVALGAVSAGLLALSACDKPTPIATVTVGTDSVHSEAACYDDGKPLKESVATKCLADTAGAKVITVAPDDLIHFGVDPAIADNEWSFFIGDEAVELTASTDTYRTFPGSSFFPERPGSEAVKSVNLAIVETARKPGKDLQERSKIGVWHFELKKKS